MKCKVLDQKSFVPKGGEDHVTKGDRDSISILAKILIT